jgi:phage terminase large subunit-like protein
MVLAATESTPVSTLLALPEAEREREIETLSDDEVLALLYAWDWWALPHQVAPGGEWFVWTMLGGRGSGKTVGGGRWTHERAMRLGGDRQIILIGRTPADARDVMIEGPGGIRTVAPPWERPTYEPSNRLLRWPTTDDPARPGGASGVIRSAANPDEIRGFSGHTAWGDEFAAWGHPDESWDNLLLGLRLGPEPRACLTTTPRPIGKLREILDAPWSHITRATSYDNPFVSERYRKVVLSQYEGTRLGRQEIYAEMLEDIEGALWTQVMLETAYGLGQRQRATDAMRVVVGVDPAMTSGENADETGIVVDAKMADGTYRTIADRSGRFTPDAWARRVVEAYKEFKADRIVAERNQGGDLVERMVRLVDRGVSYTSVVATRGKHVRAEPVAALYERGEVGHAERFPTLEDQLAAFTREGYAGPESPDRADAHVWAMTDLMSGRAPGDYGVTV